MSKKVRIGLVCVIVLFFGLFALFFSMGFFKNNKMLTDVIDEKRGLARMIVNLTDANLEEVNSGNKEDLYRITVAVEDGGSDNSITYDAILKGRGNSTWIAEKKPYGLKFDDKMNLLGLGYSKKWVLMANYYDDTSMRNDLANYLAKMINKDYPLEGEYVELVIDGEELGLYYLMQSVGLRKNLIRLKDSLGILVELDNMYYDFEDKYYRADNEDVFVIHEVVVDENEEDAIRMFLKAYNDLVKLVDEKDYDAINEVVDTKSLAEFYLISEISNNPDAFFSSWYFYKDGVDDKIHVGPAWDFDLSFGNTKWTIPDGVEDFFNPLNILPRRREILYDANGVKRQNPISALVFRMLEIEDFRGLVMKIYKENLLGKSKEVLNYISERADFIREYAIRDNTMWEKNDFEDAVLYLSWWVENRFRRMEQVYGEKMHFDYLEVIMT